MNTPYAINQQSSIAAKIMAVETKPLNETERSHMVSLLKEAIACDTAVRATGTSNVVISQAINHGHYILGLK